jgi:hypothetical protein
MDKPGAYIKNQDVSGVKLSNLAEDRDIDERYIGHLKVWLAAAEADCDWLFLTASEWSSLTRLSSV